MEIIDSGFIYSDDPQKIDAVAVHHYLSTQSYWAQNIPLQTVQKSIDNSLCFGIYKDSAQVGFARWITDKATFAYLADVYVSEIYRVQGKLSAVRASVSTAIARTCSSKSNFSL